MSQLTGKRIRQLRLEKNLSQEELGEAVGVRKAAIHKYESGLVVNIKQDTIEKLAEILQTTPQFLLGYSDEPAEDYTFLPNAVPFSGVKRVPLLGEIACGQPILAVEDTEEYVEIDANEPVDFALRCKGDSMINARILDGDIVYIRSQPRVEAGEIAAVLVEGEATLKRVYIYPDKIVLTAENPAYAPFIYSGKERSSVRILGKAMVFKSVIR